jgi:hypothetical protein
MVGPSSMVIHNAKLKFHYQHEEITTEFLLLNIGSNLFLSLCLGLFIGTAVRYELLLMFNIQNDLLLI